jgi:hypothetical protein
MSDDPILPRLELPAGALLLYESMVLDDPDRTGNYRFYFGDDGRFFQARNTQLWLTSPEQFDSDDPALFWNRPFPPEAQRYLTEAQQAELVEAICRASFSSLSGRYRSKRLQSPPTVERWTAVQSGTVNTVVVENEAAPKQLLKLREAIDQLVEEAPAKPAS